jgi:dihydropyrimidinase
MTTTDSKDSKSKGVTIVTVRGKIQVQDGNFIGERGRGRLLKREPIHF